MRELDDDKLISTSQLVHSQTANVSSAQTIQLPLDHFSGSDNRTFPQRYWVNDSYYRPGGPIIFFDGGEGGITPQTVAVFGQELVGLSAPVDLARRFNGMALVVEHRYYGESVPDHGPHPLGEDFYRYLSTEQALEDVVFFAEHFMPHNYSLEQQQAMHPTRTPWIFVGGSYPGARAALMRVRNPDVIFASWASSAVVQAQVDMWDYFLPMYYAMWSNCTSSIHEAISYADGLLMDGTDEQIDHFRVAIYNLVTTNATFSNVTIGPLPASADALSLYQIANILSYPLTLTSQSYQSRGFDRALKPFCTFFEENLQNTSATTPNATLTAFLESISWDIARDASQYNASTKSPYRAADGLSWSYQFCSEWGFLQIADPENNPSNMISRFNNHTAMLANECYKRFPWLVQADSSAPSPNVSVINKYGGWHMTPSNTMFSNGEVDPWRSVGVHAVSSINRDAPNRPSTQEIPKCGVPPSADSDAYAPPKVFGNVYAGQVHAQDLLDYTPKRDKLAYRQGIELFSAALKEWLPCFHRTGMDRIGAHERGKQYQIELD